MIFSHRITIVKFYSIGFVVDWHLVFPYYHWSGTAMSCSLHHSLLNPLPGSDYISVVSLTSVTACAGFAFPHDFGIIPFSSLYQPPYAVPQQACSWHPLCSREEEQPVLGIAAFVLRSSSAGSSPAISAEQQGLACTQQTLHSLKCCHFQRT